MKYTTSFLFLSLTLLTACHAGTRNPSDISSSQNDTSSSYASGKDPGQELLEQQQQQTKQIFDKWDKEDAAWAKSKGLPYTRGPCPGCGN